MRRTSSTSPRVEAEQFSWTKALSTNILAHILLPTVTLYVSHSASYALIAFI